MKEYSITKNSLTLAIILFVATSNIFSQNNNTVTNPSQECEHMTIVVRHFDSKISKIIVSNSDGYYEEIKKDILKEKRRFDYSPVLKIIDKYSNEGWKTISSNMTHVGMPSEEICYTYYFLKRLKAN